MVKETHFASFDRGVCKLKKNHEKQLYNTLKVIISNLNIKLNIKLLLIREEFTHKLIHLGD